MTEITTARSGSTITAPLLFTFAIVFALLFNGLNLIWFSLSMFFLTLLAFIMVMRNYACGFMIGYPWLTLSMMLFWLWLGINIPFSTVTYLATINFWWVGTLPFVYLIYTFWPGRENFWASVLKLLLVTGVTLSLYAIYQYYFVHGEPVATFFNRNSLAVFLNLLIFPAIALYLSSSDNKQSWLMILIILLFAYTIGIIKSRGAGLGFILAYGLFFLCTFRQTSLRRWSLLSITIIAAVLLAALSAKINPLVSDTSLLERVATLQDIDKAGFDRFVIWQPAWDLFLQHPLSGIGLGSYYLAIPPYLHLQDFSAQYYVHNDYLQIALETGIPGLIMFLSIYLFALLQFIRAFRASTNNTSARIQLLAVSAALLTVSFHGFFTFIIYTMPLTMLLGLYFARLNDLADQISGTVACKKFIPEFLRKRVYTVVTGLVCFIIIFYFSSLALSTYYSNKGILLARYAQLREAHHALVLAQLFAPKIDTAFYKDADLLQKTAQVILDNEAVRKELLLEAEEKAKQAAELNPLRPQTPYILARIYAQLRPGDTDTVLQYNIDSLKLNPRFLKARLALAQKLYSLKRTDDAYLVLRNGIPFVYKKLTPTFMDYLALGVSVSRDAGDMEMVDLLEKRIKHYQQQIESLQINDQDNDSDL